MAKDINASASTKPRRALNDVDFAAAIQSLSVGNFQALNNRDSVRNFTFGSNEYAIAVNGRHIQVFLSDVRAILEENAHYERAETELRRANQQFADEHVRLSAMITEQAGVIEDNERRLANQAITIRDFQAERGALLQKEGSDAEAMKILARRKGDVEELVDDLRVERENLLKRIDCQRNTIIGFQQRAGSFDAEATRLREELAAERAARREEAANAAAEIESLKNLGGNMKATAVNLHDELHTVAQKMNAERNDHTLTRNALEVANAELASANANFRMADRALSARNDTIAAMEKHAEAVAQVHQDEKNVLQGTIKSLQKSNENLSRNVTHYALEAGKQRDALAAYMAGNGGVGKQVSVALTVHKDGSVTVDSGDAPVVLMGHVSVDGNLQIKGALSS